MGDTVDRIVREVNRRFHLRARLRLPWALEMIDRDAVMPLLLEACPSFAEPWAAYRSTEPDVAGLLYLDLGELARHLVELLKQRKTSELGAVFAAVERLHLEGDALVKEAATIGLLEGIQNCAASAGVDPDDFVVYLLPESRKWWDELERFWAGRSPYVGAAVEDRDD